MKEVFLHPVAEPSQRPQLGTDSVLALLSLYWGLSANRAVLAAGHEAGLSLLPLLLIVALLHYLLLAPLLTWRWARPVLALLAGVAAACAVYVQQFGVAFDPGMLRNALHTDWSEARELLGADALLHMLGLALPAWALLALVRLRAPKRWPRAVAAALARWLLAALACAGLLAWQFQGLAPLMREHRELRYQLLPAAPLWSLARVAATAVARPQDRSARRQPIGQDAKPGASWAGAARPRLFVLVVGETVRAANWGPQTLPDGSPRSTTPQLDAMPELLRWPVVKACGSDTETSLPCMFAPVGRRDYDVDRIRGQESLLHVLGRAGVKLHWVDNQSGCKGVCDGLPTTPLACDGGRCLDDRLFAQIPAALEAAQRDGGVHLLVLHMLGNHGPAYHRRVPEGSGPFQPACRHDELARCSAAELRNAYDNALHHTDRLLAQAWRQLQAAQAHVDGGLLFIPDHGESLGEHGLFLHGMPYALAPKEQTEVPMLLGLTPGWPAAPRDCLRAQTQRDDVRHDHLFHTLLGLLDVQTALHEPAWDLLTPCAAKP